MNFLRYPGGKRKLMSFLADYLPEGNKLTGRYIEPFVGGGSVFFHVQPSRAILADINRDLTELYRGIRAFPHKVWEAYSGFDIGKEAYYKTRNDHYEDKPLWFRAARTLYLNRTCFKGMWRHSPNGNFSVGYGGEERRWVITHENIIELSHRLRKAEILRADFTRVLDNCRDGDFVFLDPPYKPGEKELKEAHYAYGHFTFDDQVRLANKIKAISTKYSIQWVMTNSSSAEVRELYKDFIVVDVPRGTGDRVGIYDGKSKEIVIHNSRGGSIG